MIDFLAPTESKCKEALIGSSNVLKKLYNKTFTLRHREFHKSKFFRSVQIINEADWLLHHEESGQTFESFWRNNVALGSKIPGDRISRPLTALGHYQKRPPQVATPSSKKKIIYIQPLGNFPSKVKDLPYHPFIIWLQTYCTAFFYSAKIRILPTVEVEAVKCEYRVNAITGRFQLNASHILTYLKKYKPSDGHCVIAVTMIDLFPKSSWDFVFGLASANHGVGVFSFARYEDIFYETWTQGEDVLGRLPDGSLDYTPLIKISESVGDLDVKGILLLRACKVMSHEICHMFGLKHCFYYECIMNGSNHLQESDRRPPFLCPVCLRKLQAVLEFEPNERYQAMKDWTSTKFWENYHHYDHKPEKPPTQRNNSVFYGRRGSLPDAIQPRTSSTIVIKQTKSVAKKCPEKRPATCKPGSMRIKSVSSKPTSRRPVSSLPKFKVSSTNGLQSSGEVQKHQKFLSKGFRPPPPPLDAFDDYSNWLGDVLLFLQSDK